MAVTVYYADHRSDYKQKTLDQALKLAMQPAQLDMTVLIEKLAPMIHGLMTKCIPQQQMQMHHQIFHPQQMNYHQPPPTMYHPPQIPNTAITTQTTTPRARAPASIQEYQDASSTTGHSPHRTPDTSPAGKKPRPDEPTDDDMTDAVATQLDVKFAATDNTSSDGLPSDLQ
jgi:hypothetical protein